MRSAKIFVALLFLLGLLFVVGINLGAAHSDNQPSNQGSMPPAWLRGLGMVIVHQQPLTLADLRTANISCLKQGTIVVPAGDLCTFDIQQSHFTLRTVALQLVQGDSATVTLDQVGMPTVPPQSLGAGDTTITDTMRVYPGQAGGKLSITCVDAGGAATCIFTLK